MSYDAWQVSLFILCDDWLCEDCDRNSNGIVIDVMCVKLDVVCAVQKYMKLNTWVFHYHSQDLVYRYQFYIPSSISAVYDALISSFLFWSCKCHLSVARESSFFVYSLVSLKGKARQCFTSVNEQYEKKLHFNNKPWFLFRILCFIFPTFVCFFTNIASSVYVMIHCALLTSNGSVQDV